MSQHAITTILFPTWTGVLLCNGIKVSTQVREGQNVDTDKIIRALTTGKHLTHHSVIAAN